MIGERLKEVASFINKEDTVLDIGTDHGYLCIYLKKNNLCKNVIASDISKNAIKMAKNNIAKYNLNIETFVSDGFKNIPVFFDTAVIAGMGTNTIIKIINNEKCPDKLVLSSNNDFYELRIYLNNNGFRIKNESIVKENNHYYIVLNCDKHKQKLSEDELLFGLSNNIEYFEYLYHKNEDLINKVPENIKENLLLENNRLRKFIEKKLAC